MRTPSSPRRFLLRSFLLLPTLLFSVSLPAKASGRPHVEPESLRVVVVSIDGIRKWEFIQWNRRLRSWAGARGSYIPDVVNLTIGRTDPNHAILWGCGDPEQCDNWEGHPAHPMHFELLRKQRGLPVSSVAIVTGKRHLVEMNVCSAHPDYGRRYEACCLLEQTAPPPCMMNAGMYEGPDSIIVRSALDYLDTNNVVWMGINLSEYDCMTHQVGMTCCDHDTACYWERAERIYREAEHQIIDVLWPFLQAHSRYAGRTLMVVTTDHGRHLDTVGVGFTNHGHGWLPDSTDCALNCAGCRDIWAILLGPGIRERYVASGSYNIEDIAPTIRLLMGIQNPFETGVPIFEILRYVQTDVVQPEARPTVVRLEPSRPNPARESTTIPYFLPSRSTVEIALFNGQGRLVYRSGRFMRGPGGHAFRWDGMDHLGRRVAPGTYFCRLRTNEATLTRKLTLLP